MHKRVISMEPMKYANNSNFKLAPYYAWVDAGGKKAASYYSLKSLRFLLPLFEKITHRSSQKAVLCFAEPPSLDIDCFPWWGWREIIPVLWDCWPKYWHSTEQWFRSHDVKSAIFTSSQTADEFRRRFPNMNILTITEGIDTITFHAEKPLSKRNIDILQYGRVAKLWGSVNFGDDIHSICSKDEKTLLHTRKDLVNSLADSKIVLSIPRCDMQPELAGNIETLTQRYWECMLSGTIILGRAPQELIDLIGYDPTVHLRQECIIEQVRSIIRHIEDYQELVDRNRTVALEKADWSLRIKAIMEWLREIGYEV